MWKKVPGIQEAGWAWMKPSAAGNLCRPPERSAVLTEQQPQSPVLCYLLVLHYTLRRQPWALPGEVQDLPT